MKANDEFEREIWGKRLKFRAKFEKFKKIAFLLNFLNFLRSNPLKALLEFIILGYNACVIYKKRRTNAKQTGFFSKFS